MISKPKIAYLRSLHNKNERYADQVFLVEWRKCISEFIDSDFEIVEWFFTDSFVENKQFVFPYSIVTETELARITSLNSNDSWVMVVRMRPNVVPKIKPNELVIVLDSINDPGNLGTIIRIADWYGITHIIASTDTVDMYNSKVLMATMWSFSRISVYYTDIVQYLSKIEGNIYWAYLNGENIHTKSFVPETAHLVIGSEAHGISPKIEKYITNKITIPKFGFAESLNAGVATAVIIDRMIWSRKSN